MRCLVLAENLSDRGATVHFVSRSCPGDLCNRVESSGFEVVRLPEATGYGTSEAENTGRTKAELDEVEDAQITLQMLSGITEEFDWVVVDHYDLKIRWEREIRKIAKRILVIDDLINSDHDCEILLNQNLRENAIARYRPFIPEGSKLFLGPKYALIRWEFLDPARLRDRSGKIRKILIYFGGNASESLIVFTLRALAPYKTIEISLVLGISGIAVNSVKKIVEGMANVVLIGESNQMAHFMHEADLAIGTCGVCAWERCLLGLPSIVVVTAENQREDAEGLSRAGAVVHLGEAEEVAVQDFSIALERLMGNAERVRRMGVASSAVMKERRAAENEFYGALLEGLS